MNKYALLLGVMVVTLLSTTVAAQTTGIQEIIPVSKDHPWPRNTYINITQTSSSGTILIVDVSDPKNPHIVDRLNITETPEKAPETTRTSIALEGRTNRVDIETTTVGKLRFAHFRISFTCDKGEWESPRPHSVLTDLAKIAKQAGNYSSPSEVRRVVDSLDELGLVVLIPEVEKIEGTQPYVVWFDTNETPRESRLPVLEAGEITPVMLPEEFFVLLK